VTLAAYPLVPKDEVGFRVQITAANGDEQIDRLCEVLADLDQRFRLQHDDAPSNRGVVATGAGDR
jgi:hypothetical protein